MLVVDFETKAIGRRPDEYPPEPVGVAVSHRDRLVPPRYLRWGHPGDTTPLHRAAAVEALKRDPHWLCWHAAFDVCVAVERLGVPMPTTIDDAMTLAFLLDPYGDLGLKPCAERYLKQPPEEANAVAEWLYSHKVLPRSRKKWGAYICMAPGDVVAPYAIGDIQRTHDLFVHLLDLVVDAGMLDAYLRERDITPMLIDNEIQGIPIAKRRLNADILSYRGRFGLICRAIYRELGGKFNIDSNAELGAKLKEKGYVLGKTPTGKDSVAKASIDAAVPNGKLKGLLLYHSALGQCLNTFMLPWQEQLGSGSVVHVKWNQVRDYDNRGARTGRISSSPNFQNLTAGEKRDDQITKISKMVGKKIELPEIRSYVEAPRGMTLFSRDYSQQELRMLAHFERGALCDAYNDDLHLDVHTFVQGLIKEKTGATIPRKHVKNINFAKVYGAGVSKLAEMMGVSMEESQFMVDAYNAALPSVRKLSNQCKEDGRDYRQRVGKHVELVKGKGITTIGGRTYLTEPPSYNDDGEGRTFEYKLLNYKIQGSSADQTKEAMRLWDNAKRPNTRFLLQIHDQLIGMCPTKEAKRESEILGECMIDAFQLEVPTTTDATYGKTWGSLS